MYTVKSMFFMLMCTMFLGCVSQQAHERAIEELEMTRQNSSQEFSQLQKEKQVFEETLSAKNATVVQLQEANKDLEAAIEVQEQVKEQQLETLKKRNEGLVFPSNWTGKSVGSQTGQFFCGHGR